MRAQHCSQPFLAELLASRVERVRSAVGLERDDIAGRKFKGLLLELGVRNNAKSNIPSDHRLRTVVAGQSVKGQVVTAAGIGQPVVPHIQYTIVDRNEHIRCAVRQNQRIDARQRGCRLPDAKRDCTQQSTRKHHVERRRDPLVRHVGYHQSPARRCQRAKVEKVPATLAR